METVTDDHPFGLHAPSAHRWTHPYAAVPGMIVFIEAQMRPRNNTRGSVD